jgi:hypothetical protein
MTEQPVPYMDEIPAQMVIELKVFLKLAHFPSHVTTFSLLFALECTILLLTLKSG